MDTDDNVPISTGIAVNAFDIIATEGSRRSVVLMLTNDDSDVDGMVEMDADEARQVAALLIQAADDLDSGEALQPLMTPEVIARRC